MMGVSLDRYLPECNAMLANEVYVKTPRATKRLLSAVTLPNYVLRFFYN